MNQMDKAIGHKNGGEKMKYILKRGLMVENDIWTSLFCPNCPMFVVCGHEYVCFKKCMENIVIPKSHFIPSYFLTLFISVFLQPCLQQADNRTSVAQL